MKHKITMLNRALVTPGPTLGLYAILGMLIITLTSCETDPNIMNDDVEETLFVWGYADMNSGMHKVRIRRAILEEGNMFDHAQNPDLLLPKDPLEVKLVRYFGHGGRDEVIMQPVVYPKESGDFSSEENIVHEGFLPMEAGDQAQLLVINLVSGDTLQSEVVKCEAGKFRYPILFGWYQQIFPFTFAEEPFRLEITPKNRLVQKYVVEIKYVDVLKSGEEVMRKEVFEGNNYYGGSKLWIRRFPLDYVFNIFKKTIPEADETIQYRSFYRFNFKSLAGSSDLKQYLRYGIRFTDNRSLYFSNIEGGYGLFYATHWEETTDIMPNYSFTDTLFSNPDLKSLKFSRYFYDGEYSDPDTTNLISW